MPAHRRIRAQARVDSSRAAIIYALEPAFGGLFGYAAGENCGFSEVVDALVMLAGVVIASLPRVLERLMPSRASATHQQPQLGGLEGTS